MQTNMNDIIRAYLTDQLPPAERDAFEQRLTDDPEFAAEAAETATLYAAIQAEGDRELEAKLITYAKPQHQMDATVMYPNPTKTNIRKMTSYARIVYAAAVLVGLIVVILPLWLMNRSDATITATPEEIYATNFTIPPAPEARGAEQATQWRRHFARGDYKTTIAQLEGLLADTTFTGRSEAFYYLGIAQLASANPEAALQALAQVREESFDWDSAQWYSALAQLKLGQTDAARQTLTRISNQPNHVHQKQAKELLEQL